MSNLICTGHEGRSWIVCWTIQTKAIGYVDADYYEVFESLAEAKQRFDILSRKDSTYVITICAVMHSSDYETHPAFEELK
jgi:hypothetical protein|tara:strand:+ start:602 stop:841 length:240 start_codon:yes stop_codon:yes gene_type:complete